jgi:ATP adenylyltransferase
MAKKVKKLSGVKKRVHQGGEATVLPLWAPWRLEYIIDPIQGPLHQRVQNQPCIFCDRKISQGAAEDRQALILSRAKECYVILNKFPYANGHLMIVPFEHVGEFSQLRPQVVSEMFLETQRACGVLQSVLRVDGLNLGMNLGRAAGAGIPGHLHIHVVPRWVGDNNFMPVIGNTRVLPEYIQKTYDRLVRAFQS